MRSQRDRPSAPVSHGDIAIVGMACLLPGAPDLDTYWQNIVSKVDAITDPPPEAWDASVFYDPGSTANDRLYCKRGGFISPLTYFDPLEHGVMPRTVEGGEPDQWLALQVARAALADAGYSDQIPERERTAVILGKGAYLNRGNLSVVQHGQVIDQTLEILKTLHPEHTDADLQAIREELKQQLPPFNADTVSGLIPNIIAGRIANRLNLMGPSYTVDAACASSLVAVDIAVHDLLSQRCDLALVGGAHVVTPAPVLMLFCQLNALSRQEKIRPFDKKADGTLLGEGIGLVVLKRLEDAVRDHHRIYAVIKGVGVSSDGLGMSVMAPRLEGEIVALQRAYTMAGLSPHSVGLIEAHGTGTPVGDETEVEALRRVFGPQDGAFPGCALGSVKSMIGHTMPAAGIAGLIRAALALYHKVLPPTLNVEEPNPRLNLDDSPFYVNTETRPWIHDRRDTPRRAGVNAFGFGGVNAHVILEEHPEAEVSAFQSRHLRWETEVCLLAAESRRALIQRLQQLQQFLSKIPFRGQVEQTLVLKDLAYTLNTAVGDGVYRLAIVAADPADLRQKLDLAVKRLSDPQCRQIKEVQGLYFFEQPLTAAGQLAFLFPGEGSQYVNMLADLCLHFPEVREQFDVVDRIFSQHARRYVLSDLIFPRPAFSEAERKQADERIRQMEGAVEAVLTANRALWTLLSRLEIHPDCVVGHSTGEYSAMLASGMLSLENDERIAQFSAELNQIYRQAAAEDRWSGAVLIAAAAPAETVAALVNEVGGDLHVAMDNCPHQTVVVGEPKAAERLVEQLQRLGLIYERLPFDRPYHTPLFKDYAERLRPFFARWIAAPPRLKTYSCTTASPFPAEGPRVQEVVLEHWLRPVEFRKTIEAMYAEGVRLFVEVGPGGNLTSFVNDILRGRPHLAAPANLKSRSGITQLNHLVGMLAAQAVPMKLDYLYRHRSPRKIDLERPEASSPPGRQSGRRMKLATGWPPMRLREETAARLRAKSRTTPADAASASVPAPARPSVGAGLAPALPDVETGSEKRANETPTPSFPAAPGTEAANTPVALESAAATVGRRLSPPQPAAAVIATYLRTMNQFLSVQQDVMQAYLRRQGAGPLSESSVAPVLSHVLPQRGAPRSEVEGEAEGPLAAGARASQNGANPQPEPPTAPQAAHSAEPAAPVQTIPSARLPAVHAPEGETNSPLKARSVFDALSADALRDVLLRLVGERTGYPLEMLDLNLDLEAHLGIDSIKRVEILGAFQRHTGLQLQDDMEALSGLKTLQEVIGFLTTRIDRSSVADTARPASTSPVNPSHPLIGHVVSLNPGAELIAHCQINLEAALFLRDHTLGRQVSLADAELRGLPIVPLTVSMEMMAEGASLLLPGLPLVEMRDIRAYRWIALERDALTLELVAKRNPSASGREVYVSIHEVSLSENHPPHNAPPIIEGTMVFADTAPEPPLADEFLVHGGGPSQWASERLYQDGMFHGPAFQGVVSIDRIGDDGAEATLSVRPTSNLFRPDFATSFVTDPVLLDQPGQVVGFWTAERLETAYVIFPFHLEALHLYAYPQTSDRARCRARIRLIGEHQVRSDLDIVGPDNRIWARFVGWEDRRFDMPQAFYRFLLSPQEVILSESWLVSSLPPSLGLQIYRLSLEAFPKDFFTAHGGIWGKVLAHLILSRRERQLWEGLKTPPLRRIEWLLGRMAAKDAVREHVKQQSGLVLYPADVEILPDGDGRPLVNGRWVETAPRAPLVSLSHSAGVAAAAVVSGEASAGVGVDIERAGHLSAEAEALTFAPREQELLASVREARTEEWPLRLWCAKESVAKALGQGMIGGPQALVVHALDASSGIVQIGVVGELARRAQPGHDGSTLTAFTLREKDLVAAVSVSGPIGARLGQKEP